MPSPPADHAAPSPSLWIGTYAGGGGIGLYPLTIDADRLLSGTPDGTARNASFGVHATRFDLHYLVDETEGTIGVHRRTASGWSRVATVDSGGAAPCHVALDVTQSCLAIANYASGSTALYRLDSVSGVPIAPPAIHRHSGSSVDPERQTSPHAHWVGFGHDGRTLYATDLGADVVLAFDCDGDRGTLGGALTAFVAAPGSGPRHMLFVAQHARTAYLACELTSSLVVLDVTTDGLHARTTLSTLPADWQGSNILAHIAGNAACDRLYVSNRGHDTIAVFALDRDGDATLIQHRASGGASPRFFVLLEDNRMIVAHERDSRVTSLAIEADGTLAPAGFAADILRAAFAFVG